MCDFFSHFRQVISKFSEIMADNSQRLLVICNQVNYKCFFQHTVKVPVLWSLNMVKSPMQFVYAGVWNFFHFEFNCAFLPFCFKCWKHNYFCCYFLVGFLIINLSFVANFEVECFWIIAKRLLHVLMV